MISSLAMTSLVAFSMIFLPALVVTPAMAEGLLVPAHPSDAQHSFRQIGQTIMGRPGKAGQHMEFGSIVRLSNSGKRMAVAAPPNKNQDIGGSVTVYERDDSTASEDIAQAMWKEKLIINGTPADPVGDDVALSEDGNVLAVRRGAQVDVYRYGATNDEFYVMGIHRPTDAVESCSGAKRLTLGQTSTGTDYVLLISCFSFNGNRGKVHVLSFDDENNRWESLATLQPNDPQAGDLFGWQTSVAVRDRNADFLTVAVSSPNWNGKTGRVQVFRVSSKTGLSSKMGGDLVGQQPGSQFGFSLDMNTQGQLHMVIGAPQCNSSTVERAGSVSVHCWSAGEDGFDWNAVGEPFYGLQEDDRFGRAVAMSRDAGRIAGTSSRYSRFQGLVRLFDQNATTLAYDPIGDIAGEALSRWGESIAMSEFGSFIASGATRSKTETGHSVGSVRVYLDETRKWAEQLPEASLSASPSVALPAPSSSAPTAITPTPSADMVGVLTNTYAPTASPTNTPSQVVVMHDDKTLDSHTGEDKHRGQWAAISVSVFVVMVAGGVLVKKFSTRSADAELEAQEADFDI